MILFKRTVKGLITVTAVTSVSKTNNMNSELTQEIEPSIISSLPDFLKKLKETPSKDFPALLDNLDVSADDFSDHGSWCEDHYKRNHILKNDRYEVILICWETGQTTPIHDHDGENCWVYFVDGQFSETIYSMKDKMKVLAENEMLPGSVSYMTDASGLHSIKNTTKGRGMTLHLYANPIQKCRVFNKTKNTFSVKQMTNSLEEAN
ncbi:MAG: cysteine dioxygenase [Paraglaciecola sp.]